MKRQPIFLPQPISGPANWWLYLNRWRHLALRCRMLLWFLFIIGQLDGKKERLICDGAGWKLEASLTTLPVSVGIHARSWNDTKIMFKLRVFLYTLLSYSYLQILHFFIETSACAIADVSGYDGLSDMTAPLKIVNTTITIWCWTKQLSRDRLPEIFFSVPFQLRCVYGEKIIIELATRMNGLDVFCLATTAERALLWMWSSTLVSVFTAPLFHSLALLPLRSLVSIDSSLSLLLLAAPI